VGMFFFNCGANRLASAACIERMDATSWSTKWLISE
jgi:hypothetical protein